MKQPLVAIFFLGLFLITGCASTPLDRFLLSHSENLGVDVPSTAQISGVPFIAQTQHHCGPASLAMVLNWAGKQDTKSSLAAKLMVPDKEGTYQFDLISASRREGFFAIPINGYDNLFRELAAGHPVIVFQNVGFRWYPIWHYAVALGYDLTDETISLHSGKKSHFIQKLSRFESDWNPTERWGLVVLPPGRLAASANEMDHLKAAAGIERAGSLDAAAVAYVSILQRWPQSLTASIGLSNVRYAQNEISLAISILERATQQHAQRAVLWHNLALLYFKIEQFSMAKRASRKALQLVSEADSSLYRKNLSVLEN